MLSRRSGYRPAKGRTLVIFHVGQEEIMSWFDSSFSFAKTALSQAQRSIDRVLDIQEEAGDTSQGQKHGRESSVSGELDYR